MPLAADGVLPANPSDFLRRPASALSQLNVRVANLRVLGRCRPLGEFFFQGVVLRRAFTSARVNFGQDDPQGVHHAQQQVGDFRRMGCRSPRGTCLIPSPAFLLQMAETPN